jgi:hypothetical protein
VKQPTEIDAKEKPVRCVGGLGTAPGAMLPSLLQSRHDLRARAANLCVARSEFARFVDRAREARNSELGLSNAMLVW